MWIDTRAGSERESCPRGSLNHFFGALHLGFLWSIILLCLVLFIYLFIFKFIYLFYLFIFGCVGSSWLRACFLQLRRAGATLRCGARASHCSGFSCCGVRALGARASVVGARGLSSCGSRALESRLSSCGAQASLLRGMWELPGPGLEPMSPALAGGFLTTAPPGRPHFAWF